jgi:SAM-dependent methyltransferase
MEQFFWENRYKTQDTGWDIGSVSTPIKTYIDQLKDKNIKILIPGAGNGYEAEYLVNQGFKNVFVLDIVQEPLDNLKNRISNLNKKQLICEDFFTHQGTYDLILEQTFFCAINPKDRLKYVSKMTELLPKNAKIVGLLFSFPFDENIGPPFGGSQMEYEQLFGNDFDIYIENCYNSIKPRNGKELFVKFIKK